MSIALHAALIVFVVPLNPFADLDVEFEVPDEIEFGVSEGMVEAPEPTTPETAPPPEATPAATETPEAAEGEESGEGEKKDAGVDAAIADAGEDAGDAEVDAGDAGEDAGDAEVDAGDAAVDAEIADAGIDGGADAGDAGEDAATLDAALVASARDAGATGARSSLEGPSTLAPGAQIALRLDVERVRTSALAPAVASLLQAIPDFHLLLDGSGIDVMHDLDRLYMATPDPLDRSRFVYAGRHMHDEAWARAAVARMASVHGETATWTRQRGVWVAPWFGNDDNPRIVALIGPQHFVVCRSEDLRAVLAYMQVRLERGADGTRRASTTGADALFTLGDGEALGVEVEGLRNYVRRASIPVPEHARAALTQEETGGVIVSVRARFATAQSATEGRDFYDDQREILTRHQFVRFVFPALRPALESAVLRAENDVVAGEASVPAQTVAALLALVQANVPNFYRIRPEPSPGTRSPGP